MKVRDLGRLWLLLALFVLVALAAVACEDDEEGAEPTPTEAPAGETPEATATEAPLGPGAAGIPSNPRDVPGFEGLITLDDGLAIFSERPADEDRTGVTDTTIKLGRTAPLSGFLANYEPGWGPILDALVARVNEAGGIHGRTIELVTKDDASDPTVGAQVTTELVEGDQIFGMFFTVGSFIHAAAHDYLDQNGVPHLFYLDGSNLGQEPNTSAWDFNGQNSDIIGGQVLAEAVYMQQPDASIAVVYADFPASAAGLEGIQYAAQQAGQEIAEVIAHDTTVEDMSPFAQQAADSGADWVVYHGDQTHAVGLIKALREVVGSDIPVAQWGAVAGAGVDETLDGVTMVTPQTSPFANPDNPIWPALQTVAEEEGAVFIPTLGPIATAAFEMLIRGLELAGPDLTREGLAEALELGFDGTWQCNACLGPITLGPQDHWTHETWHMQIWRNDETAFELLAEVSYETSEGKGVRGNVTGYDCQAGTCPWKE